MSLAEAPKPESQTEPPPVARPAPQPAPPPVPPPAPQAQANQRIFFADLPCEIQAQIFQELLVLRYKYVPLSDETTEYEDEDAFTCTKASDSTRPRPASYQDCRGLFHMDETILRPQAQPMHPQVLRVCQQWCAIGRRILVEENTLFAVANDSTVRNTDMLVLAKERGLFCREVSVFDCSARPIVTLRSRGVAPCAGLRSRRLLVDTAWAPAMVRHIARSHIRRTRSGDARGNLAIDLHAGPITVFGAPARIKLLQRLWTDNIFPLFAGHIELKVCPIKGRPSSLSHIVPPRPNKHTEELLINLIDRQRRELDRAIIHTLLPDASLHVTVATINTFLTDLHILSVTGYWPSKRQTTSFELDCARIHAFLLHLDQARRTIDVRHPVFQYICNACALFDLLLGILVCNASAFPWPNFHNLTGSTAAQRLAAGRALLCSAQGLHQLEERLAAQGLIEEPRRLVRSYASVLSAFEGIKMRSTEKEVVGFLRQAYFLLMPEEEQDDAEPWLDGKEKELMELVQRCGTVVLPAPVRRDRNHWWEHGVWVRNLDGEKFRGLVMEHWEEVRFDAGLDQDVFAAPRFEPAED